MIGGLLPLEAGGGEALGSHVDLLHWGGGGGLGLGGLGLVLGLEHLHGHHGDA